MYSDVSVVNSSVLLPSILLYKHTTIYLFISIERLLTCFQFGSIAIKAT